MAEEKPFVGSYPNSFEEPLFISSNQPNQTDIPRFSINFPVPSQISSKSAIMENSYSNTSENPSNLPVRGAHRLLFHNRGSLPNFQNSGLAAYDGRNIGNFILPQDPSMLQNSNPNKPFCAFKETSKFTETCGMIQKCTPRRGKWTEEETDTLRQLVDQLGENQWAKVAENMPGRGAKQCKCRWINCEKQDLKKDKWSIEEDKMLIQAHRKFENQWTKISKWIPGRSENNIKNHWYATKRQKLFDKGSGIHPGSSNLLWNYIQSVDQQSRTIPIVTTTISTEDMKCMINQEYQENLTRKRILHNELARYDNCSFQDNKIDLSFDIVDVPSSRTNEKLLIGGELHSSTYTEDMNYQKNLDELILERNKYLQEGGINTKLDMLHDKNFVMPEGSMMDASEVRQIGVEDYPTTLTEDFNYLMNQDDSIPEINKFLLTDDFFPKIDLLEDEKIVAPEGYTMND